MTSLTDWPRACTHSVPSQATHSHCLTSQNTLSTAHTRTRHQAPCHCRSAPRLRRHSSTAAHMPPQRPQASPSLPTNAGTWRGSQSSKAVPTKHDDGVNGGGVLPGIPSSHKPQFIQYVSGVVRFSSARWDRSGWYITATIGSLQPKGHQNLVWRLLSGTM
jgi:hypothetical protein